MRVAVRRSGWMLALLLVVQPGVRLACELTCLAPAVPAPDVVVHHCHQPSDAGASSAMLRPAPTRSCEHEAIFVTAVATKRCVPASQAAAPVPHAATLVNAAPFRPVSVPIHAPPRVATRSSVLRI